MDRDAVALTPADLGLDIGGMVLIEFNADFWTDLPAPERVVSIHDGAVRAGDEPLASRHRGSAPAVARSWSRSNWAAAC